MDRTVTIEHPYDRITLQFRPSVLRKQAAPLSTDKWDALEKAERRIYYPGGMGTNGYTDVMCNDGDEFLNTLWSHTADQVINTDFDDRGEAFQLHETARRVAQCFAIMAFGADILIKG